MTTAYHARLYDRFKGIQNNLRRKKLCRMNQGSNFPGSSFSNRDNIRVPIQFRRECQPQHLKRWFFLVNRLIHFYINSFSVIRLLKWNKLSFSSIEISKLLPAPVHTVLKITPTKCVCFHLSTQVNFCHWEVVNFCKLVNNIMEHLL